MTAPAVVVRAPQVPGRSIGLTGQDAVVGATQPPLDWGEPQVFQNLTFATPPAPTIGVSPTSMTFTGVAGS